jgi:hypothetical protein
VIGVGGAAEIYYSQQHRHQQEDDERELYHAATLLAPPVPEVGCGWSLGFTGSRRAEHRWIEVAQFWATRIVEVFDMVMDFGIPG